MAYGSTISAAMDKDTCDILVQDPLKRNSRGSSLGLSVLSTGNVGTLRETHNYDHEGSPAGRVKDENLDTSNSWRWDPSVYSIPDQATLKIYCSDGSIVYMRVRGAQKTRRFISRAEVPLTKCDKPTIAA